MEYIDVKGEKGDKDIEYADSIIKNIAQKRQNRINDKSTDKKSKNTSFKIMAPKMTVEKKSKITEKEHKEAFKMSKNFIFDVLSLPMVDKEKRPIFKDRLQESEFMNRFCRNTVYDKYLSMLEDKHKFWIVYGLNYADVYYDMNLMDTSKKNAQIEEKKE